MVVGSTLEANSPAKVSRRLSCHRTRSDCTCKRVCQRPQVARRETKTSPNTAAARQSEIFFTAAQVSSAPICLNR